MQDLRRRHDLRLSDQGFGPQPSDCGSDGARSVDSVHHSDAGTVTSGIMLVAKPLELRGLRRRSRVILKPAAAGQSRRKHPHECGRVQLTRSAAGGIGSAPHVLAFFLTGRTGGQNQALTDAEGDGAEGAFPWQLQSLRVEGVVLGGSPMVPAGGRVKSYAVRAER